MMANDGSIAEDTLFEPERLRARAIDWDQGDRGLSSGRAVNALQSRRRIHGRNRHHASINRKTLAPREPSIHGSSNIGDAYASRANREALRGQHRDGIMRKAARGRPLRQSEKRFTRLISKRRFRVEQYFGTMKRLFGLHRARYFGGAKTHAQMAMAAIGWNLLKAANKITLNPQTPATA